ncbi:acyl carrier protein [Streptomyces sp. BE230]|uniref:acyl carrier protein n=1 Tax=Streptomyces sp. BE230 TaxID=3002526 RepID=UPI002ED01553|nr:acyl carrier protein [Streptomyces sp. BE230]
MHDEFRFSRTTPAEPGHDRLLSGLLVVLADVLRIAPDRIDPEETFRLLGLDSILCVQFVTSLNSHYGTDVRADVMLDHPTPTALARHLARTVIRHGAPAAVRPAPARSLPQDSEPSQVNGVDITAVAELLREELARILSCDAWDIRTDTPFTLLGVDSVVASEFVAAVNRVYGLREPAGILYDHPDLGALAAYIATVEPPQHVPEVMPAAMGVHVPGAAPLGIGALLDAVRAGWLSIDDAVALLSRTH